MKKLLGYVRRHTVRLTAGATTLALTAPAMAADPTYTSSIGDVIEALDLSAIKADMIIVYGVLFGLSVLGIGFRFMNRNARGVIK